ncbi:TPR end-of-group domain-containing protein [Chondromyces crocatus]|uniref:MalT-like TPR region domain-containing protein n=1 Tax=Chondromyces crocatus TaxID=52 RepID=A0A0K1E8P6_CHOCO|nr:tetratricopeptide repeat protein [Chondromyces crocatus]AKT37224.1 uncharacterized protein CMC5_013550 [Chondromyces crocatus]
MIKQLLGSARTRDEVDDLAQQEGFARSYDSGWIAGLHTTSWRRGEDVLSLIADAPAGAAMLVVRGPNEGALAGQLGSLLEGRGLDVVHAEAREATQAALRVRSLLHLGFLLRGERAREESVALLGERLGDVTKAVRWAAFTVVLNLGWEAFERRLAEVAARHDDMRPALGQWATQRRREAEERARGEAAGARDARRASLAQLAREGRWEQLLGVAEVVLDEEPAEGDHDHALTLEARALALSELGRYEEAIAACDEALADSVRRAGARAASADEGRGRIYFHRACAHARLERESEAVADLREAVKVDPTWGAKARRDEAFQSLWERQAFLAVAQGREGDAPTSEEVERLILHARRLLDRGEGLRAVESAEEATGLAELLGDPARLSEAMACWGHALLSVKGPAHGIARLKRALTLAEQTFPEQPERRAEVRHLLGAAYHAGEEHDAAARCYRMALSEHIDGVGERHWRLARSYGALARLDADQGRPEEAIAGVMRGRASLVAFLEGAAPREGSAEEDDHVTARIELVSLSTDLGRFHLEVGAVERALDALEEAVQQLAVLVGADRRPAPALPRKALQHVTAAAERTHDEALRARAEALTDHLHAILEPSPLVRAERVYWARLREGVRALVAADVDESAIARAMRDALRGIELPPVMRAHPAFACLSLEFATRLRRESDLILVAVALSAAEEEGSLGDAIDRLEELAVASVQSVEEKTAE